MKIEELKGSFEKMNAVGQDEDLIVCSCIPYLQQTGTTNQSKDHVWKKKTFLKFLNQAKPEELPIIMSTFSRVVKGILRSDSVNSIRETLDLLKLFAELSSLTFNILEKNLTDIMKFFINSLQIFDQHLRSKSNKIDELHVIDSLHVFLQTAIMVTEKSSTLENVETKTIRQFYYDLRRLLKYDRIPLNTINNCGLLIVTLDYNFLELTASFRLLKHMHFASKAHLAVCYGFVAGVPTELLSSPLLCSDGLSLLTIILEAVLLSYDKYPNDCIILISSFRILSLITQRISLSKACISSTLIDAIISFLWSHLDHFQDVIKHVTRDCMNNLVTEKDDYCIGKLLKLISVNKHLDRRTCILILCLNNKVHSSRIIASRPNLTTELLDAGKRDISHSYISQTFNSLMISSYYENDFEVWFDTWILPLLSFGCISSLYLDSVLIQIIKLSDSVARKLFLFCTSRSAKKENYLALVKCLTVLHKFNLETCDKKDEDPYMWCDCIPLMLMQEVLRVPGSEAAIATISLILESRRTTSFSRNELMMFRIYLNSNICNLNTYQRSLFLPLADKIISRLVDKSQSFNETKEFFTWLSDQCYDNLFAGVSFSRCSIVLRILESLHNANVWHLQNSSTEQKLLIFTCLGDSFDENKLIAKKLIASTSFPIGFLNEEQLRILYVNIVDIISSARFCEHDTAVYLLELLQPSHWVQACQNCFECFDGAFTGCSEDILRDDGCYHYPLTILAEVLNNRLRFHHGETLRELPVYGFFFLARRLFENAYTKYLNSPTKLNVTFELRWKSLINEFAQLCIKYNVQAASVVSQSSPEGYLPQEELENMEDDDSSCFTSAQRLLLISWRTVKEASLTLAFFVEKFSIVLMADELILEIGSHLQSLLLKMKHRGAFEQVYIALIQYCQCCWRYSSNATIRSRPQQWLESLALSIETKANTDELCACRRSAGVPYIVQAVLSTEYEGKVRKHGTSDLLNAFVARMMRVLEADVLESKIHAANILRALFRNKDLDEQMSYHIETALTMAIRGIESSFWNERNVSWLLFSSLMTKIFGVARSKHEISPKNKMTVKAFFRRYPSLLGFLKARLQAIHESEKGTAWTRCSLYPILLIFQRLECSREEYNTFELNSFISLLYECSGSPVWKIRELVASAIIPFITVDIYEHHIRTLWNHLRGDLEENFRHGLLLQLVRLLLSAPTLGEELLMRMRTFFLTMLEDTETLLNKRHRKHSHVVEQQFLVVATIVLKLLPSETRAVVCVQLSKTLDARIKEAEETQEVECNLKGAHVENLVAAFICVSIWSREEMLRILKRLAVGELTPKLREVFLEAIGSIVLEGEFVARNEILRNMSAVGSDMKEEVYSIIFPVFLDKFSKEWGDYDVLLETKILKAYLESGLECSSKAARCLMALASKSKMTDEDTIVYFVRGMDAYVKEQEKNFCNTHSQVLKCLTDYLSSTYSEEVYKELLQFYFARCHGACSLSCEIEISTITHLNTWTLILSSSSYYSIQYEFENLPTMNKESPLLDDLMKTFYLNTDLKNLTKAVMFTSLILRDVGFLYSNCKNENSIFIRNIPQSLEDDLFICNKASFYLKRILTSEPDLLDSFLGEELSQWMSQQCSLADDFRTLRQLVQFITHVPASQEESTWICSIRADYWRGAMARHKFKLLTLATKSEDIV